jgi:hypothetical protein
MKLKCHWWCMLILLQHAKCIASFICIGSYVIDLWSRPYWYSIMRCSSPHLVGCAGRRHFCIVFICIHEVHWSDISMLLWSSIIWLCSELEVTHFILILYLVYSKWNSKLNCCLIQPVVEMACQNKFSCWDVSSHPCITQSRYMMLAWKGRGLAAHLHWFIHT